LVVTTQDGGAVGLTGGETTGGKVSTGAGGPTGGAIGFNHSETSIGVSDGNVAALVNRFGGCGRFDSITRTAGLVGGYGVSVTTIAVTRWVSVPTDNNESIPIIDNLIISGSNFISVLLY
jgi:hypothetical protein